MYIPLLPPYTPRILQTFSRGRFPFDDHGCISASGRQSIGIALHALGLKEGDEVLLPAYMCDDVVYAVREMQYVVHFYNVPINLQCTISDIELSVTAKSKAILITHYFGYPQKQIEELVKCAHQHGIFLIEDCAHTLSGSYRDRKLGTFGDAAIFSPRKILGGPLCGITWMPSPDAHVSRYTDYNEKNTLRALVNISFEHLGMITGFDPEVLKRPLRKITIQRNDIQRDAQHVSSSEYDWKTTIDRRILRWMFDHSDLDAVHAIRVQNHALLTQEFSEIGVHPLIGTPAGDWSPYAYALWIDDRLDELLWELQSHGIGAAYWPRLHPEISEENFPDAINLRSHVLLLPIHQMISPRLLKRVSKVFQSCFKKTIVQ